VNYNKNRLFIGNWRKWRVKTGTLAEIFFAFFPALAGAGLLHQPPPITGRRRVNQAWLQTLSSPSLLVLADSLRLTPGSAAIAWHSLQAFQAMLSTEQVRVIKAAKEYPIYSSHLGELGWR
jgi:hypothetical protein